jgi:hypothetical protein
VVTKTTITLMAEYTEPPWPLWRGRSLLGENDLALSTELKDRLKAWLNAWWEPSWVQPTWPMWEPPVGASAEEEEALWVREGEAIREALEAELGDDFEVLFEP